MADSKKPLLSSVVHEPEDTSLEDAVVRVCGGEKASSVQRSTGIPRTTILSAYYRFNGSHLNTSVGRPVSVEPVLLQDLKASAKKRTMDGNCWERVHDYSSSASILIPGFQAADCPNSFAHELHSKYVQFQTRKHGDSVKPIHLKPLSISTVRKYEKRVCSEVVHTDTDKGGQNKRRAQALADMYNFISLAVAVVVAGKFLPQLTLNFDRSSTFLGDKVDLTFLESYCRAISVERKSIQNTAHV